MKQQKKGSFRMKNGIITQQLKEAFYNYTEATEKKERIAKELEPLLDAKLIEMRLKTSPENIAVKRGIEKAGELVINRDELYMCSEEDAHRYYEACHEIYKQKGYEVELYYCPILIARSEEVEAEHKFIDEAMYLIEGTGLTREELNGNLDARREFVALTLNFIEGAIGDKNDK